MPPFGPIKRKKLIAHLRQLGFEGPPAGGKHEFMRRGNVTISVPNPHRSDIGRELLGIILKEAGIPRTQWDEL